MRENLIKSAKIIYLNDVGGLKAKEQSAIDKLISDGVSVQVENIDWHASEKFEVIINKLVARVKAELKIHRYKYVLLVGAGAGGSMAVNIMARMHEKRLYAITLCSRLTDAKLPSWDRRSLDRVTYIGKPNESKLYFDSVVYCANASILKLSKTDKLRIVTARQKADPSIPRQTMEINGIRTFKLKGVIHSKGMADGIARVTEIVNLFN